MTKAENELRAMRNNPQGWRYEAVARQLRRAGFSEKSRKGSHRTWKHEDDRKLFTVKDPGSGDVKSGYIRELVARVDRLTQEEEAPDEQ